MVYKEFLTTYILKIITMKVLTIVAVCFISLVQAKSYLHLESRIINGKEAKPHQFPFSVIVDFLRIPCTGSLIRNDVVLTAAQCVYKSAFARVLAGVNSAQERNLQKSLTKTIIAHKSFEVAATTVNNDIALLILKNPIKIDNVNTKIIPLMKDQTSLTDQEAFVSGWGINNVEEGYSDTIRYMSSKIISNEDCGSAYNTTIDQNKICLAGSKDNSPCQGDSGAPLFIERDGQHVLVGLSSYMGSNTCKSTRPTVYTRISEYIEWINLNLPK